MLVAVKRKPTRTHSGADGGSGWFGAGVAAAPLPLPYCFGAASSLYFLCSLYQQGSSLSSTASWRCWWWQPGKWPGWWPALLPLLLCVFFFSSVLLCFRFFLPLFTGLLLTEMAMAAGGRPSSSLLLLRYFFSLSSHLASLLLLPSGGSKSKVGGGSIISNGGDREKERGYSSSLPLCFPPLFCSRCSPSLISRSKKAPPPVAGVRSEERRVGKECW